MAIDFGDNPVAPPPTTDQSEQIKNILAIDTSDIMDITDFGKSIVTAPNSSTVVEVLNIQFEDILNTPTTLSDYGITLTGDVTAAAGDNATTIANDAVTNAKLANMATATIKGRTTAGTGDPEDLTATQARTVLGLGSAATLTASMTGGASVIPQFSATGNFTTGSFTNDETLMGNGGNIYIPDLRGIKWMKKDGELSSAYLMHWEDHDYFGGETILESPHRVAIIAPGAFQLGNNSGGLRTFHLHLVSGESTVSRPIRWSPPISFQTKGYNSGSQVTKRTLIQAVPSDATNATTNLKFFLNGSITDSDTNPSTYTENAGLCTGDLALELDSTGAWHPGQAPSFTTLTDGATITQTCSRFLSVQSAKVRIAGNRTLAISGATAGMRGVIYVKQDAVGNRTLALPSNSVKASGFALSTTAAATDRLAWEYDGTYFFWTIANGLLTPTDSDVATFIGAGRANITDQGIIDALNDMVIAAKASNVDGTGTLWSKALFLYPMAGGTATAHSKDLKGAFDITNSGAWTTGVTHNANGITGDGSTGFGASAFDMADAGQNNFSIYAYCSTELVNTNTFLLGATNGTTSRMVMGDSANNFLVSANTGADGFGGSIVDARRHLFVTRSGPEDYVASVNSSDTKITAASVAPWTSPIYILARNGSGTASGFTNANLRFVAAFSALSSAERTAWRAIVDIFQTALSRANP